ncbi:MAG: calcium/sodium antiporter [Candidatus Nanoarchaeia archaeon]|nr:calcium/sodium antiporter [Candidatus Nanoarchaeia archaeon]
MLYDIIIVIAALAILIKSSDYFVDASSKIARAFGVSEFVIGVTLVAVGTSLPELASSIAASFYKNSQLVTGPIIGANIARIGLVLGICAVIAPIIIEKRVFTKEGFYLLFISLIFAVFAFDKNIGRIEGIILLVLFMLYMLWLFETDILKGGLRRLFSNTGEKGLFYGMKMLKNEFSQNSSRAPDITLSFIAKQGIIIALSCAALFFSAKYLIPSLENLALLMKIPDTVVGLLVLGLGTTLPEMVVCISAARKNMGNMIMGTIIGSNIADTLLVIGISSLIHPISPSLLAIAYYMPAMILFTVLLLAFIRTGWVVRMFEGFALLLLYAIFLAVMFYFIKTGFLSGIAAG